MANVGTINFLYLKSYNGEEIWEPVKRFSVSNHLDFTTVKGDRWQSTRIQGIFYDAWHYELVIDTRSGASYVFRLVAPYGMADCEVAEALMVDLSERIEETLS